MSRPPVSYRITVEYKEYEEEIVITIPAMALGYLAGDLESLIEEMVKVLASPRSRGRSFLRFLNVEWLSRVLELIKLVMMAERPHNIWQAVITEPRSLLHKDWDDSLL